MAQRQFRSDDTSLWIDKFGYGSDGAYAPSTGTDAPIDSACSGTSGATSLTATNGSFAAGQLILIHQTRGIGVGTWELNKIQSYSAGTITTSYPLINTYTNSGSSVAQVLVMKQYSSGNIAGGVTITLKAWDGTSGGIYAVFCSGTFTIAGALVGSVVGHMGGAGVGTPSGGKNGEGTGGAGQSITQSANGNSGGGGGSSGGQGEGGAGGGNATAGGTPGGSFPGTAGASSGVASLVTMTLGGAGGSGAAEGSASNNAGNGGGIVFIISRIITITGSIALAGQVGGNGTGGGNTGGSGGGAGGSCLLKGQTLTLGASLITAASGAGGTHTGSSAVDGGAGSVGRIHADYALTLTGTTNPTLDSTQDITLLSSGTLTTNSKKW